MASAGGHGLETLLAAAPPAALPRELAERFDAWLAGAVERAAPLSFTDLRRGVQALSQRYVERRPLEDALGSPAKRAAFASYFAALHFLTAYGVVRALPAAFGAGVRRIVDLGAGSGAAAAGVTCALAEPPEVLALDRSAFALAEARLTLRAFGLRGEALRTQLPSRLPKLRRGDLALAGWFLNECDDAARARVLRALGDGVAGGARLLVLEPLAGRAVPWWDEAVAALRPLGVASGSVRWRIQRPAWIALMDKAARLDHAELGARVAGTFVDERGGR
jgi:SAM-dependent methyltransferase